MTAISGGLVTVSYCEAELPSLPGAGSPPSATRRAFDTWAARRERTCGPASSVRAVADGVAIPLLRLLGFSVDRRVDDGNIIRVDTTWRGRASVPMVVVGWGQPLDAARRTSLIGAIRSDSRWCFCCNGTTLRLVDAHRTWSHLHLTIDLDRLADDPATLSALWSLARAEAFGAEPPLLDRAADQSARRGVSVRHALAGGVLEAVGALCVMFAERHPPAATPDERLTQSLTVVYRVLFLLFAEARGLVPVWHPVYRDRYTIESIVTTILAGRRCHGVWEAVQAISRLAHAGHAAGGLHVNAFNGRLFSPDGVALFDQVPIDDDVMGRAVAALSTSASRPHATRRRVRYDELDVEDLGAVYEQVLDYEPAGLGGTLARTRDVRKATGTYYTPRSLTGFLVRDTLAPLVEGRSAEGILQLRVLDPAMGSGAFLVAACDRLAEAAEDALVRDGQWHRSDVTPADRVRLRREVAQRCLYGVDLNPTAVHLARLSLWLSTLASDRPLTFLDHRLVAGDSLVGATPADVLRQPGGGRGRGRRGVAAAPLFDLADIVPALERGVRDRRWLADEPDASVAVVRTKERLLASLQHSDGPLGRWRRVLDAWCAGWFSPAGVPTGRAAFGDVVDSLLRGRASLPPHTITPLLANAERVAARHRFHHWPIAFPEVFSGDGGEPLAEGGFDAVVGNPPWDMIRGDSGAPDTRRGRQSDARALVAFARHAGVYRVEAGGHANRYQLFLERALQLTRRGGRIGMVLPRGLMADVGTAALRRYLFDHASVDRVIGLDNRAGIFPVHRGTRFVLITCTTGEPTAALHCRFGVSDPRQLDDPETARGRGALVVTRSFLARVSGADDLAVPEVRTRTDLGILERVGGAVPWLGAVEGWHVGFGRELNASDDRSLFRDRGDGGGRAVLEGKHLAPFRALTSQCRYRLADDAAVSVPRRPRLAYRDVASPTNRLTLIAAIVPANAVTTHTLFCLKAALPIDAQHVLCGLLNSLVANYLVRLRVTTHVTATLLSKLPVPRVDPTTPSFRHIAALARTLARAVAPAESCPEYVELQALAARAYGLTRSEFACVLETFPLIGADVRARCLDSFSDGSGVGSSPL